MPARPTPLRRAGTPIQNNLSELWGILNVLDPKKVCLLHAARLAAEAVSPCHQVALPPPAIACAHGVNLTHASRVPHSMPASQPSGHSIHSPTAPSCTPSPPPAPSAPQYPDADRFMEQFSGRAAALAAHASRKQEQERQLSSMTAAAAAAGTELPQEGRGMPGWEPASGEGGSKGLASSKASAAVHVAAMNAPPSMTQVNAIRVGGGWGREGVGCVLGGGLEPGRRAGVVRGGSGLLPRRRQA